MTGENGYSSTVRGWLLVHGHRLPLAQVGPDDCILRHSISYPPTAAEVVLEIDGESRHSHVFLDEGICETSRRVRFSRRYVAESRWHASQQLAPQPDGSLIAEFDLSSTVEIRSWLLSLGRHAEVLEPQTLRDEIRQEAQAMADQCRRRPTSSKNREVAGSRSAHGDGDNRPTLERTEATREH